MKKIVSGILCSLIVGCATQKPAYLPDGSQGHNIDCSGTARDWGMCYQKAGELCKERGYDVVSKDEQQDKALTLGGTTHRTLIIKCK